MRIRSIDAVKGALILLVIIGHILQGTLQTNVIRHAIYSFHMPVFIAVSGYLLNTDSIKWMSFGNLVNKYMYRIIIPWVIALLIYGIVNNSIYLKAGPTLFFKHLLVDIIKPYYHLWFIPAFISWILVSWLLLKASISINRMLITAFVASAFFLLLSYNVNRMPGIFDTATSLVLHTFRPYFFFFFALGIFFKKQEWRRTLRNNIVFPIITILFVIEIYLFYQPNQYISFICFFVFNILLIYVLLPSIKMDTFLKNRFVEWIGANSLGIYLWHVLPIILAAYIAQGNYLTFYCYTIIGEIIFLIMVATTLRFPKIGKYLYGL